MSDDGQLLARMTEQMRSGVPGLYFTSQIEGRWRRRGSENDDHAEPAALARHHLRERARAVLARYPAQDLAAAQDALNARIGHWFNPGAGIQVRGTATLGLSWATRRKARRYQRARDAADGAHHAQVRALRGLHQILADPPLRIAWLLDRHPDTPGVLDRLDKLAPAAPLESAEDEVRAAVFRFVEDLLDSMPDPRQREIFLNVLLRTLQEFGRPELHTRALRWREDLAGPPPAAGGEDAH